MASRRYLSSMAKGVGIMGTADFLVQRAQHTREGGTSASFEYDKVRGAVLMMFVGGFSAPFYAEWYRVADKVLPGKTLIPSLAKGVGTAIITGLPVNMFFLSFTQILTALMKGTEPDLTAITTTASAKAPILWRNGIMFWGVSGTINFMAIPAHHRVTFMVLSGAVWMAYLSLFQGSLRR
eukprot:TRINITY_DN4977_c0_g1_i1.p2 TRINITY_DN4977_c0_g1~~TRINITY_DN4977_c0_g1_i1.p2  ORF type:complete len:180 (+),score=41.37 TRINITY_DN4977_c0_g1_i1:52-591(+)